MVIAINIILFVLEVLYYSLFMKYTKKEGKLYKYLILFTLCSLIVGMINSKNLLAYLFFILGSYVGLKYVVKTKTSLYDMLVLVVMLLLKVIVELPLFLILYNVIHINHYLVVFIVGLVKLLLVFMFKSMMNNWYNKMKEKWNNDNFNIRYGFTILIYLYVILTIALLIKLMWR